MVDTNSSHCYPKRVGEVQTRRLHFQSPNTRKRSRETHLTMDKYAGIMLDHIPAGVALFDARDLRLLAANKLVYRFFQMHHVPSWDAETVNRTLFSRSLATNCALRSPRLWASQKYCN